MAGKGKSRDEKLVDILALLDLYNVRIEKGDELQMLEEAENNSFKKGTMVVCEDDYNYGSEYIRTSVTTFYITRFNIMRLIKEKRGR